MPLKRIRVPELMDDPNLPELELRDAFKGIERLNWLSKSADLLWPPIRRLAQESRAPLRLLDLAAGSGDIAVQLQLRANQDGIALSVEAADISNTAVLLGQERAARKNAGVRFFQLDATSDDIPHGYDIITTSLFTHHLDPDSVVSLLVKMRSSCQRMVLVNDLVRSHANLLLVKLGTRIFSRSNVVHHDGPASVRAAYTVEEMAKMAVQAGMHNIAMEAKPTCRMLLIWRKEEMDSGV